MRRSASVLAALFATQLLSTPLLAADQSFPVGAFNRVSAMVPYDVKVVAGRQASVRAVGDQEAIDRLDISVVNGELRIGAKRQHGWMPGRASAEILVTAPTLTAASLIGSGGLSVDRVAGPSFSAALTGSGDLSIARSEAESVNLSLTGSGDLSIAGRCGSANVALRGSGDLDAGKLQCRDVSVVLAGSGDVDIGATGSATLALTGSGDINVTGGARCTQAKRGSGEISCR